MTSFTPSTPTAGEAPSRTRILLLNPNSSEDMTDGMLKAVSEMNLPDSIQITPYTASALSPASINNAHDLSLSTDVVLADMPPDVALESDVSGVLVACYSSHPLVERLVDKFGDNISVLGIFEASILAALALTAPYGIIDDGTKTIRKWGIVTTGEFWERHLADGVRRFLLGRGQISDDEDGENAKFAGVQSTGLNAGDFHDGGDGGVGEQAMRWKLKQATRRLLACGEVACVLMGCAGMAGLEEIIREVAVEEYGEEKGRAVFVVDGVKAGVTQIIAAIEHRRMFRE